MRFGRWLKPGKMIQQPILGKITETRLLFLKKKEKSIFGGVAPQYLYQDTPLPDPITSLDNQLRLGQDIYVAPIHGDLNLQNVLVDTVNTISHMIDFAQTREDHILRDAQSI